MPVVSQILRVLLVEDDPDDAALIVHELRQAGLEIDERRVATEAEFESALRQHDWEVIIADYSLVGFDARRALAIYRGLQRDIPFILVSGTVHDDVAIACMRAGAHDYVLKNRLARLAPVVQRECKIRAERRRAEERYRLLIENCNDMVTEMTRSGEIHYASPNHRLQLALAPEQFVGTNVFDRIHPDDRAIVRSLLNHEESSRVVYRFRGGDAAEHWLESSGRTFLTAAGEERLVVVTRDISEKMRADETRQRLETQLRQSQKMEAIGTLAGGIAHDFNNILVGIIGNVQLAQLESAKNPAALARLEEALKAGQRARDLVAQILTFSRQREQSPIVTGIGAVVSEALRLLRASLPSTIAFDVYLDPDAPAILCDTSQIHQIVMNLATNAAHAMRERGGRLHVTLNAVRFDAALLRAHPQLRPGAGLCLTVSDTGCGMDAATRERLFEPFFTTKPPGEGTGLGLAVVQGIVKSHEAAIAFESTPGRGSTFHLYFSAAPETPLESAPIAESTPHGHGERLLLLDDEPSVAIIGELLLQRLGYEVDAFSEPAAALAAFHRQPGAFQCVITDLTMPGMSGLDLAQAISAIRPQVPVLLMSGNSQATDIARAKAAGILAIIDKPFSIQQLAQQLEAALAGAAKSA